MLPPYLFTHSDADIFYELIHHGLYFLLHQMPYQLISCLSIDSWGVLVNHFLCTFKGYFLQISPHFLLVHFVFLFHQFFSCCFTHPLKTLRYLLFYHLFKLLLCEAELLILYSILFGVIHINEQEGVIM